MEQPGLSLPKDFEDFLKNKLVGSFPHFLKSLHQPPPTSIRFNPKKNHHPSTLESVPWCEFGKYIDQRPTFTLDPIFHAGAYYVQEASSMFLEQAVRQALDLNKPLTVLDLCAAPGGKSTHLQSLLHPNSLLVSNEVIRSRASILVENIQKWGYGNAIVTNNDPEHFQRLTGFFDLMVVDAPCSGEGLFRKDRMAMQEWSTENVELCSKRQRRILHDAWPSLKENGLLVYCTCTFNEFENEDTMLWLQQENDIEFIDLKIEEDWGIEKILKGNVIGYRFYPHKIKGEGFFLSAVRKKNETSLFKSKGIKKGSQPASKAIQEKLSHWILNPEQKTFLQHEDFIFSIPTDKVEEFHAVQQNLKIVLAGTTLASAKHDKLVPNHALALSVDLNRIFLTLDLDRENALKYLRKETLPYTGNQKGFALAMHEGLPLGWVNLLNTRVNNMYPSEWRIRMAGG